MLKRGKPKNATIMTMMMAAAVSAALMMMMLVIYKSNRSMPVRYTLCIWFKCFHTFAIDPSCIELQWQIVSILVLVNSPRIHTQTRIFFSFALYCVCVRVRVRCACVCGVHRVFEAYYFFCVSELSTKKIMYMSIPFHSILQSGLLRLLLLLLWFFLSLVRSSYLRVELCLSIYLSIYVSLFYSSLGAIAYEFSLGRIRAYKL